MHGMLPEQPDLSRLGDEADPDPDFVPAPAFVEEMSPQDRETILGRLSSAARAKYDEILASRRYT